MSLTFSALYLSWQWVLCEHTILTQLVWLKYPLLCVWTLLLLCEISYSVMPAQWVTVTSDNRWCVSICCHRNPDHHKRPCFDEVFTSFSSPEPVLTSFGDGLDSESVPPTALMLGSHLAVARWLYLDLQHTYRKKSKWSLLSVSCVIWGNSMHMSELGSLSTFSMSIWLRTYVS